MVNKKLGIFNFLALGFNLALAINLVIIFFIARTNGQVLVSINQYNEQWVETIFFPLVLLMGIIALVMQGKKLRRGT